MKREKFSKVGFVLSCIGAAIGLGNIWMFPYRLGQYGGAAFLIPYFLFVFGLGTIGLMLEFSFGRKFKGGSSTGISKILKEKNVKLHGLISIIPAIGLMGVFMFYNVVVGWILKYFNLSITGEINKINTASYFDSFIGTPHTLIFNFIAIMITLLIVFLGVTKGIEKINKIIMPGLFVIFIILAIRSLTLPNAMEGVKYLLRPDFSFLLKPETWVMALGQAFFTVSLNGCGMVVYGSYIGDDFDIPKSAFSTAILDTLAALLVSFVIMPAVFSFGLNPQAGPPLLFITMPTIFKSIPGGSVLIVVFFLSILFAAISSSINMLEGPVEALMQKTNLSRGKASVLLSLSSFILSIPLNLSMDNFSNFTDLMTIIVSPLAALLVAIIFLFVLGEDKALEEINLGSKFNLSNKFILVSKYLFTITTICVIVLGVAYGGIG
nr:sodium-dependent transporter [Clostridium chrysemydis]